MFEVEVEGVGVETGMLDVVFVFEDALLPLLTITFGIENSLDN